MQGIDPVILKLEADLADYKRDLTSAQRLTDTKLDAIEKRGEAMGQGLKRGFGLAKAAAVGFVASMGVSAITGAIDQALNYAKAMRQSAEIAGAGVEEFQRAAFAAKSVGIESEKLADIYKDVNDKIGDFVATGGGAMKDFFDNIAPKVGVTADEFKRLSGPEALQLYVSSLEKAGVSQKEMTFYMEAIASDATALIPLLRNGGAAFNELANAADRLGVVLSADEIQNADEAAKKLEAVKMVLSAKIAGAVADNAGAIITLANAFTTLIDKAGAAVTAYQNWRREVANRQDQLAVDGWFTSDADRKAAQDRITARNTKSRVLMPGGGPVKASPNRPKSGFGAPITLDPAKLDPWAGVGVSSKYNRANLAGEAMVGTNPFGFEAGAVKGGLEALGGTIAAMTADMMALTADLAIAQAELTGDIAARAEAEKMRIAADLASSRESLAADKDMTQAKRDEIGAVLEKTAAARTELVEKRLAAELAAKSNDARAEAYRFEADALEEEADAAVLTSERREIERRLLALQQEEERARLEAAIAAGQIADAAEARAALERKRAADSKGFEKSRQGPIAALTDYDAEYEMERLVAQKLVELNDGIAGAISNAMGIKDPFIRDLIGILLRKTLLNPIAEALDGISSSGGGGLLGGLVAGIGAIFGRASGGYVAPGQMVRVNEGAGAGRVEGFMSRDGGQIIPLGRMNAMQQGSGRGDGVVTVRLDLSGDIDARIQEVSAGVAVEVVRSSAPALIDASSKATMARAGRMRI